MGFMSAAQDERVEYLVVASSRGRLTIDNGEGSETHAKCRLYILEDRRVIAVLPTSGREIERREFTAATSTWAPASKLLTVNTLDGGTLVLDGQGCGCNMGAVGNAGPADGPYKLVKVRAPDWHTVI